MKSVAVTLSSIILAAAALGARADDQDPKVAETLQATTAFMQGQANVHVKLKMQMEAKKIPGFTNQTVTLDVQYQKPNRMVFNLKNNRGNMRAVTDGKQLYMYDAQNNRYSKEDAPQDLGKTKHSFFGQISNAVQYAPALPYTDLSELLLAKASETKYVGKEELNGVECHHLHIVSEQSDLDAWVEAGDRPVIHQVVMNITKTLPMRLRSNGADFRVTSSLSDWKLAAAPGKDTFTFTPPEGAELTDDIQRPPSPEDLVGKTAPPLNLELVGGGKVDLAKHKGKEVVILDFWATWCGPCVRAMPIITKVAGEFEKQGVVFYAVNLQEDAEKIQKFLKDQELDLTVAMDSDGRVGAAYRANAIPQTVIVGKDGRVQVVHVGLLPNLEDQLTEELTALVAGKDLTKKAAKD